MNTTPISSSFPEFVRQLVQDCWDSEGQPLLLSRIGQKAVAYGFNLNEILGGRKLAKFIEEELRDVLVVEPTPQSTTLLQARPAGAEQGMDQLGASTSNSGFKLNRVLWLAFSRPIAQGHERRLQVRPYLRFWDAVPPLTEVSGRLPIAREYLAPTAEALQPRRRDDVIVENIRRWMRDNGLDISEFEDGRAGAVLSLHVSSHNPLMLLIAALDEGEQKRVSLPLDVIAKLLKK